VEFSSFLDYQKFMADTKFSIPIERPEQNQVKLNITDEKMWQLFTELSEVKVNFISEIKFTLEDYFMDFYDRKKTVADGEENLQYGLH
ncbi:MAG TPA: ABC transporter ATP-binding protein, partial [Clostridiales bacterium]|nr:ABC transporter ATP-binding protein [Clostridiales bacterium]